MKTDNIISIPVQVMLYCLSMVLIVAGNVLVVIVVLSKKKHRTPTNLLICGLASTDLIIGIFVVPSTIYEVLEQDKGNLGVFFCIFVPYLQLGCISASIGFLLVIAIDRFRAIVVIGSKRPSLKGVVICITCTWILSLIYACRMFLMDLINTENKKSDQDGHNGAIGRNNVTSGNSSHYTNDHADDDDEVSAICSFLNDEEAVDLYFRVLDFICIFLIPIIIMCILYFFIARKLWMQNIGSEVSVKNKRAVVKMLAAVVVIFTFCWGPMHIVEIIHDANEKYYEEQGQEFSESKSFRALRFASVFLSLSNSWMNPIAYAYFNTNFRDEIANLLCACCRFVGRKRDSRVTPMEVSPMPGTHTTTT